MKSSSVLEKQKVMVYAVGGSWWHLLGSVAESGSICQVAQETTTAFAARGVWGEQGTSGSIASQYFQLFVQKNLNLSNTR